MLTLDDYINRVKHLPPAPRILPELLELLRRHDVDNSRVVQLISFDPALTAGVLQVSNSAFFASATPVSGLDEAVMRLGFAQLFQLVVAISSARALTPPLVGYGLDEGDLWKHSVTSALAARIIARELGEDENLAFTAGLLHDIGKIVLAQALEGSYAKLMSEVVEHQQAMVEAEKRVLGVEHAEVGGRLLSRWKFPESLIQSVLCHHRPAAAQGFQRLAALVYLGNMIAYFLGHGYGHAAFAVRGRAEAFEILNLSPESLTRHMIQTFEEFKSVDALFGYRSRPAGRA